jgi:hypothetical protein
MHYFLCGRQGTLPTYAYGSITKHELNSLLPGVNNFQIYREIVNTINLNYITDEIPADYIGKVLIPVQRLSASDVLLKVINKMLNYSQYFATRNVIENRCLGKEV